MRVSLAPSKQHAVRVGVFTLCGLIVAISLQSLPAWRGAELKLFDTLTVLTAPRKSVLPISIIGIDEASFAQIDKRWPWPRSLYAQLIDRLAAAGAAVIVIDVLFPEPSESVEDEALAASIARAGNVVLAADYAYQETALVRQWLRVDPIPLLTQAGAVSGLATVRLDPDAFVRKIPYERDALWRRAVETLMRVRPGAVGEPDVAGELYIRHLGPAHTFPYVSFYQVVRGDASIPGDYFRDQIVIVGRDLRSSPEVGAAQDDLFATSFLGTSGVLTPGAEVHATLIENLMTGQAITAMDTRWVITAMALALLLGVPALIRWHPVWSGAWTLAIAALVVGVAAWLFARHNLWLPAASTLTALGVLYIAMGLYSFLSERRRAEQITNAFGKYVSPQVVKEIIARPELLTLGGKRCEMTVLFSDLEGFTSISEKLPPENVAKIVNTYLTAMTRLIISAGGTVDKFIGDAVMAFWGAPLDDPEHALHAVSTAMKMQAEMQRLQVEFEALGCGSIGMRIGINSGPVIVGNMGSDDRFDYTVVGDTVNLASRLEGVNKIYGTGILMAQTTARLLPAEFCLRKIDVVRVAGKRQPVSIFSPCDDLELVRRTDAAFEAYSARDWIAARQAWAHVVQHASEDGLAALFAARIAEFESSAPSAEWDGAIDLKKG